MSGGDEVVKDQWQASPRVQARMRELGLTDEAALQGYFTRRLGQLPRARTGGASSAGTRSSRAGLPPDAIGHVLARRRRAPSAPPRAGHDTVLAPDPTLYLDHRQGSASARAAGPRCADHARRTSTTSIRCRGSSPAHAQHVLGVQANLWTEHVRTEERAAYMTCPRAAALAEVAWSPAARLDWDELPARACRREFARYRALGVPYSADVFAPPRAVARRSRGT